MTAGSAWLNGAFGKVAKAGQVAGTKTRAKWNVAVSNLTAKVGVGLSVSFFFIIFFFCDDYENVSLWLFLKSVTEFPKTTKLRKESVH